MTSPRPPPPAADNPARSSGPSIALAFITQETDMRSRIRTLLIVGLLLSSASLAHAQDSTPTSATSASPSLTVVLDGVTNPRGFTWGDDGTLYLALAGSGGDARFPIVEGYTVVTGLTSSVVTVADGCATPLAPGLISTLWEEMGWVWGAMDVAVLNGDLYLLLSGAGPTWGSPSASSGVFRRNDDGTLTLVADISTWLVTHPPAFVPPDYATDGSLFDIEATSDALLVSEAVGGQIIRVTPDGEMSTLADLSEQHPVPTGIAVDADDNAYVTFETTPPYADGSNKVVKITPDGTVSDFWTGLTRVADLEFSPDGQLYAAELSTNNTESFPFVLPHTGRIVRQSGPDTMDIIAEGLDFPVGLGFDGAGALYVSGPANGATPEDGANVGAGWLARVEMDGAEAAAMPSPTCMDMAPPAA